MARRADPEPVDEPAMQSAVAVAFVGIVPDPDDPDREWHAVGERLPGGGGMAERPIVVGDHVPLDHVVVRTLPDRFKPSTEPPLTRLRAWPTEAARERQHDEERARQPVMVRDVTYRCARCGWTSDTVLVPEPLPVGVEDESGLNKSERQRHRAWIRQRSAEVRTGRRANEAQATLAGQHRCPPDATLAEITLPVDDKASAYYGLRTDERPARY